MKKIKICSVVVGSSLKEFLVNLDRVQEDTEMVELRVDLIKNLSPEDLILIREKTKKESIVTSRTNEIFQKALELKFDLVDVDLDSVVRKEIVIPKNIWSKIIISFHNFKKTPDESKLLEIIKKINKFKPNIIKIATMVNNEEDSLRLLKLIIDFPVDKKKIIIGMGIKGRTTRIVGPLLGNFLTYASTNYGQSADGQLKINELRKIYKLID